jgi:hypothetical protein
MLRFARTRRDEERFKSELEAARTVQQVLIPEEIPAIPGLALECESSRFRGFGAPVEILSRGISKNSL